MSFIFNFFTILAVISAILILSSRNPIHSIMFFVLVICNISGYLFLLHVEFLALIFLVVYVGAVSILFLFIVMMLNVRILDLTNKLVNYFTINSFILLVFVFEISLIIFNFNFSGNLLYLNFDVNSLQWINVLNNTFNIVALGQILYLYYFDLFIIAGFVLLVSMIASIILTLEYKIEIRNPNIYEQILANTRMEYKY